MCCDRERAISFGQYRKEISMIEKNNYNGVTPSELRAKTQQPIQSRKWQLAIMNPMEKTEYKEFWTNPKKLLDYIKVCYLS